MQYEDPIKVKLATLEFHEYALIWWEQEDQQRRRRHGRGITMWHELKHAMDQCFISPYYDRECCQRLQHLSQGHKSVKDYQKELGSFLMRAKIQEEEEAKMTWFLYGSRNDVAKVVELCDYGSYHELVHKAIKVEKQVKCGSAFPSQPSSQASKAPWTHAQAHPKPQGSMHPAAARPSAPHAPTHPSAHNPHRSSSTHPHLPQGPKAQGPTSHAQNIKCLKCRGKGHYPNECPNKKVVIVRPNGELCSDDEEEALIDVQEPMQEEEEEDKEFPLEGTF